MSNNSFSLTQRTLIGAADAEHNEISTTVMLIHKFDGIVRGDVNPLASSIQYEFG